MKIKELILFSTLGFSAYAMEGPTDEVMVATSVQMPKGIKGSSECWIDRLGHSSTCSEDCKTDVESLNVLCNGGHTVGYIEEKDPCCALVYGVGCFPLNVMWRAITFPWQLSMDCCDRNKALYALCGKEDGSEVNGKKLAIKYVRPVVQQLKVRLLNDTKE